jgi:predicted lipoprotein
MQRKIIKYSFSILLLLVVAYNSVYFKKLDEVKTAASNGFDAAKYARNFYNNKLLPDLNRAIELDTLIQLLKTAPEQTFKGYSHALDIGNTRYFLVKGEGNITAIGEDAIAVALTNDGAKREIKIATEFIYGNAIRDASGLMNLNDFSSVMDFNSVSEEVNKIIRKEVVPAFKAKAKAGDLLQFVGAIELNQVHLNLDSIQVVPVTLAIEKPPTPKGE